MSKASHCTAVLEDRTILFDLTPDQERFGQDEDLIPIFWEQNGQVFYGEIALKDLFSLDIQRVGAEPIV